MSTNEGTQSPRPDQVNIITGDMERSLAFYRLLGLEFPAERVWQTASGSHHAALHAEGLDLEFDSTTFAPHFNAGWQGRSDLAGRVIVTFRMASREEVDARYATLTGAGYHGTQPPFDAFWGARYAVVEDPDGLAVGLMSPVDEERRAAPPEV